MKIRLILGLTGFSGAGKSTVAAILKENGFYHLDCDAIVHHQVYRDPNVLQAIAGAFGAQVLDEKGLNRPALRQCTMGNPEALKKLNAIVMPFILDAIEKELQNCGFDRITIDAPLLFESGLDQRCDKILSVISDPQAAMERIIARDHLTKQEAEKRLTSQHNADFYIDKSHYIIKNNGDLNDLHRQVIELLRDIYEETL